MTGSDFGREIKANPYNNDNWEKVYMIEKIGNTVRYVRPNCDRIVNCHELDCDLSQRNQND